LTTALSTILGGLQVHWCPVAAELLLAWLALALQIWNSMPLAPVAAVKKEHMLLDQADAD
jgi:hypothetical protein